MYDKYDHIDKKLDDIDSNVNRLVGSLDVIIENNLRLELLSDRHNILDKRVTEHSNRIDELESFNTLISKRVQVIQVMSISIFLIASAGAIAQFLG